jgi:hypothetical protein
MIDRLQGVNRPSADRRSSKTLASVAAVEVMVALDEAEGAAQGVGRALEACWRTSNRRPGPVSPKS